MGSLVQRRGARAPVGEYLKIFPGFFAKNFLHDRIFISAASLAFQTLLSFVPVLAIILSILNVFSVFIPYRRPLELFLVQNFMPGSGPLIMQYLPDFLGKTSTVPLVGGVFLFIISLSLISTIDHTLNQIWEVHAPRKTFQGFTLYWMVLTLGPVLIGSSLAATSYVWYTMVTNGPLVELKRLLLVSLPFFNTITALFLLYMLVPNRRVKFLHALSGAVVAAVLFELSKKWFSFYVGHLSTFEHIYGALSVVPMFFFWIYIAWIVVLTGAEFVYCLGAVVPVSPMRTLFTPLQGMGVVLRVLKALWVAQNAGAPLNVRRLYRELHTEPMAVVKKIVSLLQLSGLVHGLSDGSLAVTRDLHLVTLYELYALLPVGFADEEMVRGPGLDDEGFAGLAAVNESVVSGMKESMRMPVASLLMDINQGQS